MTMTAVRRRIRKIIDLHVYAERKQRFSERRTIWHVCLELTESEELPIRS